MYIFHSKQFYLFKLGKPFDTPTALHKIRIFRNKRNVEIKFFKFIADIKQDSLQKWYFSQKIFFVVFLRKPRENTKSVAANHFELKYA